MKKIIIVIGVVFAHLINAQNITDEQVQFNVSFEDLENISLSSKLRIRDLHKVDNELKILESLGKPINVTYKNEIAYETWRYEYSDMTLMFINQNGYIEIQSVVISPKGSSKIKIGSQQLNSKTRLVDINSISSSNQTLKDAELRIGVNSVDNNEFQDIKFTMRLDHTLKFIHTISIIFNTTQ